MPDRSHRRVTDGRCLSKSADWFAALQAARAFLSFLIRSAAKRALLTAGLGSCVASLDSSPAQAQLCVKQEDDFHMVESKRRRSFQCEKSKGRIILELTWTELSGALVQLLHQFCWILVVWSGVVAEV